ncbi:hypothetical protein JTB14_025283 [Gonioctena quinquepunctata]|nr:hypothetical protein JTB14_025283 [Gonioctena quinquepunctata]
MMFVMWEYWIIIIPIFLFLSKIYVQSEDSELISVVTMYRHGDRGPTKIYPKDPFANEVSKIWPDGFGELTSELIPLIFGFELPIMTQNIDATSSYVVKIQDQYRVQVMFKTRPKLHATLVLVKGVEWEVEQVKRATLLLMEYMCENLANQIPVQMSMEISPHHHQIVLGKNHSNLKLIMQYTNCQIMFPDAQDPNIPSLKKSNVNISGNIHDVYRARQLLLGCLPLIIIFDLPRNRPSRALDPTKLRRFRRIAILSSISDRRQSRILELA